MRDNLPSFLREPDPEIFLSNNYVILDVETTNKDFGDPLNKDNRLLMTQIEYGPAHPNYKPGIHVKEGPVYDQFDVVEDCEKADFIVAHNAKFECGWLWRMGANALELLFYDPYPGS